MRLSEIKSPGFRSHARLRRAAAAAAFLFFASAPAFGPAPAGAQSADDNRLLTITGWSSDGSAGEVRALLGRGANPNVTDSTGRTPVHRAASITNSQRTLRVLLEGGGRTDLKDGNGDTPLHLAAAASPTLWESDSINAIEVLLSHSAQPDAANRKGETPLHIAARTHRISNDGVAALLKAGANPNRADARGDTPLHAAVGTPYGDASVIGALLDGGADPKKRNRAGLTALQLFVLRGANKEGIVAMLVAAGADPDRKYRNGDAPLHAAVRNSGKTDVVEGLLGGGADPCARDSGGKIPWQIARGKSRAALERAKGHEIDCEKKQPLRYRVVDPWADTQAEARDPWADDAAPAQADSNEDFGGYADALKALDGREAAHEKKRPLQAADAGQVTKYPEARELAKAQPPRETKCAFKAASKNPLTWDGQKYVSRVNYGGDEHISEFHGECKNGQLLLDRPYKNIFRVSQLSPYGRRKNLLKGSDGKLYQRISIAIRTKSGEELKTYHTIRERLYGYIPRVETTCDEYVELANARSRKSGTYVAVLSDKLQHGGKNRQCILYGIQFELNGKNRSDLIKKDMVLPFVRVSD